MAVGVRLCLVFTLLVVSTSSYECPQNNPRDELSFRGPPASVVSVREGQYKMVHCCVTGYTNMAWYKQFEDGYFQYPWYVGDENVQEKEANQSLKIFSARKIKDGGMYKCVARNDSHVIHYVIRLDVIECEMKYGRIDITQKPTGPITAGIGERREISCEGNFGCLSRGDLVDRTTEWIYRIKDSPSHWISNNSRFTIHYYNKENGTIVGNRLVIKAIELDDYKTVYTCILQTPKNGSRTGFNVTIIPPETNYKLYYLILLLVPVVVMVTFLIIYCCYKQRIQYFYRRTFKKLPKRGDVKYDLLLLYCKKDEEFVQNNLKPKLKGYKIFDGECVLPGQMEIVELQKNIDNSYATVIICTSDFLKENKLCYTFDIADASGARIFIVQIKEMSKTSDLDHVTDSILKKAPTMLTTIKWPWNDPQNPRKLKNFYCKLKKNLPLVEKKWDDCDSSCRPLLASVSSNGSEVRLSRSSRINITKKTPTETQLSQDSGISSPINLNTIPEFDTHHSVSVPINHIEE